MKNNVLERAIALVVDDHPETLQLLIDALEAANLTVLVATAGKDALDAVERLVPDVILLDAVMPEMDGFATCLALKQGPAADVPVIFMTGLEETEHIVRGLEAGGIDYLTKPIVPDELLARMRVHLSNSRSARGVRAALDVSGRTLLAVDAQGRIKWATPQAQHILTQLSTAGDAEAVSAQEVSGQEAAEFNLSAEARLPPEICAWVSSCVVIPPAAADSSMVHSTQRMQLRFRLLSRVNENEILLVIQQADPAEIERNRIGKLQQCFSLTTREAEVLYWLSRGKSNRDIATILGMSYRTVDKHLEHVYPKIGVESRSAASAASVRILEEQQP